MAELAQTNQRKSRTVPTLQELWTWSLVLACVSYWTNVVRSFPHGPVISLDSIVSSILGASAFNIVAWVLIAAWTRRAAPSGIAPNSLHLVGTLVTGLLCIVPAQQATACALFVLGALMAMPPRTGHSRNVSVLLFCLAIEIVWTSTPLLPLHALVATLDTRACEAILGLLGQSIQSHGNELVNVQAGITIEVLGPCASSFPIAGVCGAFLITLLYWERLPHIASLPWLGLTLLASVVLTEIRLCLMSTGEAAYTWLHDGGGVTVYALIALALAVLFPTLAAMTFRVAAARVG
jgi:hypothetical protein